MIKMWTAKLKCFLAVIIFLCVLFTGSDTRAIGNGGNAAFTGASAYAGASASGTGVSTSNRASMFAGTYEGTGGFPDTYDRYKGIRSYGNSNFPYGNNANRGLGSHTISTEHGASQDQGIRNQGRDHNKNGCPKCKWENDDYWERDEPEEEEEEKNDDECDDGDDGQYRPHKTHHHDGNKPTGHRSRPPAIHKTGPIESYDGGVKEGGKPGSFDQQTFGNTDFPSNVGYAKPSNAFGTTSRPGSSWDTEVRRITPSNFGSSPKSSWHNGQGIPPGSFTSTQIPSNWNSGSNGVPTAGFPSPQKPIPSWNADHNNTPLRSYSTTPNPWSARNDNTPKTGFPFTQGSTTSDWIIGRDNITRVRIHGTTPDPKIRLGIITSSTPKAGLSFSQETTPNWNADHDNIPARDFSTTPSPWSAETGSTPKAGFPFSQKPSWTTERTTQDDLDYSKKPKWDDGTVSSNFRTTPKPELNWNSGLGSTPIGIFPPYSHNPSNSHPQKPGTTWNTEYDKPDGSFGVTPKDWDIESHGRSGPNWNPNFGNIPIGTSGCNQPDPSCTEGKQVPVKVGAPGDESSSRPGSGYSQPSGIECSQGGSKPYEKCNLAPTGFFPSAPHGGNVFPSDNHENPVRNNNVPYTQPGIHGTVASSPHPKINVTPNSGSTPHGGTVDFKKGHPFELDKPANTHVAYGNEPYNGVTPPYQNVGGNTYGSGSTPHYNKPGYGAGSSTLGITEGPYSEVGLPEAIPGDQHNYNPGRYPNSPSGINRYPDVNKPIYGGGIPSTNAWPGADYPESGRNTWPGSRPTSAQDQFPVSNTGFETTKIPFAHISTPRPTPIFGNPYDGTKQSKQPDFTIRPGNIGYGIGSSTPASTNANTFRTPLETHSFPSIIETTPSYDIPKHQNQPGSYPGIKSIPAGMRPTHGISAHGGQSGDRNWPIKHPSGSEIWPSRQPGIGSETWPSRQPGSESGAWSNVKPDGGIGTWPSRQPGIGSGVTPSIRPESGIGTWPNGQPGPWPGNQFGSNTHPFGLKPELCNNANCDGSIKPISGSGCSSVNCEGSTAPGVNNNNCGRGNYNCPNVGRPSNCNGRDNGIPTGNGPCSGIDGPSGVNKTYYPAGTGNVPNIGNTYGPNTPYNIDSPGSYSRPNIGCKSGDNSCNQGGGADVTEGPIKWNSANPFLFGARGGTPSDVSRPWNIGTTAKPLGKGNPFLPFGWSVPKPEHDGANGDSDKNVIPLGGIDNKPIGQYNPFLQASKPRSDIEIDERVIPLGEKMPEAINPFLQPPERDSSNPIGHNATPDEKDTSGTHPHNPSYTGHPGHVESGIPGSGSYGNVKGGFHHGRIPLQPENYPSRGSPQDSTSSQCKLGLFGCGTPGSGSYAPTKDEADNNFQTIGHSNAGTTHGIPNSWDSTAARTFASSNSRNWSGSHPVDVKG